MHFLDEREIDLFDGFFVVDLVLVIWRLGLERFEGREAVLADMIFWREDKEGNRRFCEWNRRETGEMEVVDQQ